MNIRKGDKVKILIGKDQGKSGKVLAVNYKSSRATVEGLNLATRHERPKKAGQKGQKIHVPTSLDLSNLMIICPNCGKPTRVAKKIDDKGRKIRICKLCSKNI